MAAAGGEGELTPGRETAPALEPAAGLSELPLLPFLASLLGALPGTSPIVLKSARASLGLVKVPEC